MRELLEGVAVAVTVASRQVRCASACMWLGVLDLIVAPDASRLAASEGTSSVARGLARGLVGLALSWPVTSAGAAREPPPHNLK